MSSRAPMTMASVIACVHTCGSAAARTDKSEPEKACREQRATFGCTALCHAARVRATAKRVVLCTQQWQSDKLTIRITLEQSCTNVTTQFPSAPRGCCTPNRVVIHCFRAHSTKRTSASDFDGMKCAQPPTPCRVWEHALQDGGCRRRAACKGSSLIV